MNGLRRYEILVPLLFNDGQPVPERLLAQTFRELRDKFGAASWETQVVKGSWEYQGTVYEDNLTRFFVDVDDLEETPSFLRRLQTKAQDPIRPTRNLDCFSSAGRHLNVRLRVTVFPCAIFHLQFLRVPWPPEHRRCGIVIETASSSKSHFPAARRDQINQYVANLNPSRSWKMRGGTALLERCHIEGVPRKRNKQRWTRPFPKH